MRKNRFKSNTGKNACATICNEFNRLCGTGILACVVFDFFSSFHGPMHPKIVRDAGIFSGVRQSSQLKP